MPCLSIYPCVGVPHAAVSSSRELCSKKITRSGQNLCLAVLRAPLQHCYAACADALALCCTTCRAAHGAAALPASQILRMMEGCRAAKSRTALRPAPLVCLLAAPLPAQLSATTDLHLASAAASARSTADDAQLGSLEETMGSWSSRST